MLIKKTMLVFLILINLVSFVHAVKSSHVAFLLPIDESIGKFKSVLTEADFDFLKSGSILNKRYTQTMYFWDLSNSGKVILTQDNEGNSDYFLFWKENDDIFHYRLAFDTELILNVMNGSLEELHNKQINILGINYTVLSSQLSGIFGTTGGDIKIELLGGLLEDALENSFKKTYYVDVRRYDIEVIDISSSEHDVLLKVNGRLLPRLKEGQIVHSDYGNQIGIKKIITTSTPLAVIFYLDAIKLELYDNNWLDNLHIKEGVKVNGDVITNGAIKIKLSPMERNDLGAISKISLSDIHYKFYAQGSIDNIYVPGGSGLKEYTNQPKGFLYPYFNIRYERPNTYIEKGVSLFMVDQRPYVSISNAMPINNDISFLSVSQSINTSSESKPTDENIKVSISEPTPSPQPSKINMMAPEPKDLSFFSQVNWPTVILVILALIIVIFVYEFFIRDD